MKEEILRIYKAHHSGKENAITRDEFIFEYNLESVWHGDIFNRVNVSDRQFRQIYSQLPIVTCEKGGFYPIRKEEILEYREYLRKKAIPLFERFKRVYDAHPELADNDEQMELFPVTFRYEHGHLINCPCSVQLPNQQEDKNDK